MDKTERIARLLAKGLKPSVIASMVGCAPSLVSNLTADPDFREIVKEFASESLASDSAVQAREETEALKDRLLALEHTVIGKLEERLEFMPERDLITLFDKLTARRDRLTAPATAVLEQAELDAQGNTTRLVRITVPTICAPDLTFSSTNEIIALGSRSVNPMTSEAVRGLIKQQPEQEVLGHESTNQQADEHCRSGAGS